MIKKIFSKTSLTIILVLMVSVIGYLFWRFSNTEITLKNDASAGKRGELIEKYRNQLTSLRQQSEETGGAQAFQDYAIALYATGDFAAAETAYRKQLEVEPNNIIGRIGLANALRDQKKFDQAIREYEKSIQVSPNRIAAYSNLASIYQYSLKQPEKSIEVYRQGLVNNPGSADLNVLLGIALEQNNDFNGAKKAYEQALRIDTNNLVAKAALGRLGK